MFNCKILGLAVCCVCFNFVLLFADVFVRGHFRKNGTYIQPHHRTAPDGNVFNNYSTKGNYNPWTVDPYTVETHRNNNSIYQTYSDPYRGLKTLPQERDFFFRTVWD